MLPPLMMMSLSLERTYFPSLTLDLRIESGPQQPDMQIVRMLIRNDTRGPGQRPKRLTTMSRIIAGKFRDARFYLQQDPKCTNEGLLAFRTISPDDRLSRSALVPWDSPPGTELKYFDQLVPNLDEWEFSNVDLESLVSTPPRDYQVVRQSRVNSKRREPDCIFRWIGTTPYKELQHRVEHWRGGRPLRILVFEEWSQPVVCGRWYPMRYTVYNCETGRSTSVAVTQISVRDLGEHEVLPDRLMWRTW
jgi:hypothetical protein